MPTLVMHSGGSNLAEQRADVGPNRATSGAMRAVFQYAVALLSAAAALAITFPLRAQIYTVPMFFAAVLVSCWYVGIGPLSLAMTPAAGANLNRGARSSRQRSDPWPRH